MTERLNQFQEAMRRLDTQELVRILTEETDDYRADALEFARNELRLRGVPIPTAEEQDDAEQQGNEIVEAPAEQIVEITRDRDVTCRDCGGKLRYASLQANSELTLSFYDAHELRFVEVDVCSRCRKVTLRADLETEV